MRPPPAGAARASPSNAARMNWRRPFEKRAPAVPARFHVENRRIYELGGSKMRAPNSIDFWRGFALVTIFVNHVPGIVFERFTFRSVSLSDSAELFVFLAGFSLRFVVQSLSSEPLSAVVYRLSARAMTIYFA